MFGQWVNVNLSNRVSKVNFSFSNKSQTALENSVFTFAQEWYSVGVGWGSRHLLQSENILLFIAAQLLSDPVAFRKLFNLSVSQFPHLPHGHNKKYQFECVC